MPSPVNIFWFRRDLRLHDNAGLFHALKSGLPLIPIFIFDRNILDDLENKSDRRVSFIHSAVTDIENELKKLGSGLHVYYGYPGDVFRKLTGQYEIKAVYANEDYESYAINRDNSIQKYLNALGIEFRSYKDQVIFSRDEIVKDDGKPYTVFTPYSRKWKSKLSDFYLSKYPTEKYFSAFAKITGSAILPLGEMGFKETANKFPSKIIRENLIEGYHKNRDFPANEGTSHLGVHLRFGTISIRELAARAKLLSEKFLDELIWRDFYQMILWNFPHIGQGKSFKSEYDFIEWKNNPKEFQKWCDGETGYPIVDAGMRELNATGYMHNRVRMIVASFLIKHLLIDWRWGEAYFAKQLLDYEFASNNGGWQWAAGSGCDAAPYFRIFNPYIQTKKFDPQFEYIRKWVNEFENPDYPKPIVEHEFARKRALEVYGKALGKKFI
ncbi:MAG: deoxyribodipyrimidine photolyase [Bacteroidetes bacterium]|nr:MAG: deoxyribodipyrimidine photolyase [Bacteroidota bacterium]